MSLKQIFTNFSWETLISLQPSELLALMLLPVLLVFFVLAVMWMATH